jgi:hypothetical protein
VGVAQEKVRRVHKHAAVRFGADGEAPQDGFRERVLYRPPLVGIRAVGAEGVVGLHHQHTWPDALKLDDSPLP